MDLTGKAREDFFAWLDIQGVSGVDISNWEFEKFHLLSGVSQNALIIEWLDSIQIYVSVVPVFPVELYGYSFSVNLKTDYTRFKSRNAATEFAINKSLEGYGL